MIKNEAAVSHEGNKLIITSDGNNKTVKFDYKISKVETLDNCIIVLLEPPQKVVFNENVFGVSYAGEILWQIKPIKHVYKDSPYTGMTHEGGTVKIFNWDGVNLIIDPKSGDLISMGYSK